MTKLSGVCDLIQKKKNKKILHSFEFVVSFLKSAEKPVSEFIRRIPCPYYGYWALSKRSVGSVSVVVLLVG